MATFLGDDLPPDEWQKQRDLQLGGGDPNGGIDPAAPAWILSDGMPSTEWQRVRAQQAAVSRQTASGNQSDAARPTPGAPMKPVQPVRASYTKRDAALDLGARHVLDRIAIGEQPDRPVSYDVTYGYGAFVPPGSKKLTEMTFDEVAALQEEMLRRQAGNRGVRSRPVGKYQFMPETLERLRKKLGLKSTDILTPGVQDMMARELLEERGYADFLTGKIDGAMFQENLSGEWASLMRPSTGKSRYGQPIGTTTEQIQAALAEARRVAQRRISEDGLDPYARRWR